jgi:transglutaminase-like putative cysteine protease
MHGLGSRFLLVALLLAVVTWPGAGCRKASDARAATGAASLPASGAPAASVASPGPQTPGDMAAQPSSAQLADIAGTLAPEDQVLSAREARLSTVDAAFTYVRDGIGFESYDGILRGADGTFHARAGNALDRAMLLAAILESHKIPVRLVTGRVSPAVAGRLFDRLFARPANAAAPAPRRVPSAATALKDRILARAHRDYDTIVAVAALAKTPFAARAPSRDDLLKEIEAHAWVQALVNSHWTDLDPSFPDSAVGQTYGAVEQAYDGPPPALMQQVTIRVLVETLQGNTLTQTVALQKTFPAYRLLERQVFLAHTAAGLGNIFSNRDVQQPVLFVDGTPFVGQPIDFAGGSSGSAAAGVQGGAVSGVLGAFGAPPAAPTGPVFVAEWLEFEVAFPGGRRDTSRRIIVDRAGTAWRRAARHDPSTLTALAHDANGLIASQMLFNVWFTAGGHDLLAFTHAAETLADHVLPAADPAHLTFDEQVWPFAMRDLSWLIASDQFIVPLINDTPGLRFYADSPRIFVWTGGPDPAGQPNVIAMESDLRRDTLRGVERDPSLLPALAQHKLWFGALEGAMEHELGAPPRANRALAYITTSSLADSGGVVVVTPAAGASVSAKDPETDARLQAALATGDTLVVPTRVLTGGMSGWWQISRDTGDLRAVLGEDLNSSYMRFSPDDVHWKPSGKTFYYPYEEYRPPPPNPPVKAGGGELGEYNLTNLAIWIGASIYRTLALMMVDVLTWGYVAFWVIGQATK